MNNGCVTDLVVMRFMQYVEVDLPSGCWLWSGGVDKDGYGRFWLNGTTVRSHRFTYERVHGAIPASLQMDHLCRVHGCCNPDHLEMVTCRENLARDSNSVYSKNSAKQNCPAGHPYSGSNLYVKPNGRRRCRTCSKVADRARRATV